MRIVWFDARKLPQVPALWLTEENINQHSRAVMCQYGIETAGAFFGIMRFWPER